ncbi:MAG: DUF4336 domain-containing protein [Myxococcales bacterium]|nr:DUF4336 domain-containing protein [Myxococcales bacterium]
MRTLNSLADGIWEVEDRLPMPLGIRFPIRMTVLRTGPSSLALISPIRLDDDLVAALEAVGRVESIVAPNLLHHLYAGAAAARFPNARVYAPEGLRAKQPTLAYTPLSPGPLTPDIEVFRVDGAPEVDEHLFLHRPSRTLVATDLVFNVRSGVNWVTRLVFRWVSGTWGHLRVSRLWRRFAKDPAAVRRSLKAVLEADFDRLVVAHGETVPSDARRALRAGLGFLLEG